MKYSLLPYVHELEIDGVAYSFKDPLVYNYLLFEEMVSNKEYLKAIMFMCPELDVMGQEKLLLQVFDIIERIMQLISTSNTKTVNSGDGFFIGTIDFFSERYGVLPTDFIKKVRIHQLKAMGKGVEWNNNLQNDAHDKNRSIIMEQEDQNDLLEQVRAMRKQ